MQQQNLVEVESDVTLRVRIKTTERECPRCEAVLVLNDHEQCYECHNCGYIDCGEDD
jgi:ribosomal protein S27AE